MDSKLLEAISLKQKKIDELEAIREEVEKHDKTTIALSFGTRDWYGFIEPVLLKEKHEIKINKKTMLEVLQQMIKNEKTDIDRAIECEIELRISKKESEDFIKKMEEINNGRS